MASNVRGQRGARLRTTAEPRWEEAVDAFFAYRDDLRPATVDTYKGVLLGTHLTAQRTAFGVTTIAGLTGDFLRGYQRELLRKGLSASTVHIHYRTLRTFVGFLQLRGLLGADSDATTVKAPRIGVAKPEAFTPGEVLQMLAATDGRNRLIVQVLLETGIRLGELCRLTACDLVTDPKGGAYIHVRGVSRIKDYEERLVYVQPALAKAVSAHTRGRGPADPVFMDRFGKPLSEGAVQTMLNRLGAYLKIHVHAHKFRHTYATNAVAAKVPDLELQRSLGHSTLDMVRRYVNFDAPRINDTWQNVNLYPFLPQSESA